MNSIVSGKAYIALALVTGTTSIFAATGEPPTPSHPFIQPIENPPRPADFKPPHLEAAPVPPEEPTMIASHTGFSAPSPFNAVPAAAAVASQTLTGPVTLSYTGTANAFSLTQAGTGRGLSASVTNAKNGMSTLYGDTTGSGAGVMGSNLGTLGPGGKFQVTNVSSAQAGAFATTSGTGPGILGTITNKTSQYPAIFGQSTASPNGIGVEGQGNYYGVYGLVPSSSKNQFTAGVLGESDATGTDANYAVYGYAADGNGVGVGATAESGYGMYAYSGSNYAMYGFSSTGSAAILGEADSKGQIGVIGTTVNGTAGVAGTATGATGYGVYGTSNGGNGVIGFDNKGGNGVQAQSYSGNGLYAYSSKGVGVYAVSAGPEAGHFVGNVTIIGTLTVGNTVYSSDRSLKTAVRPIDGKDLLERVRELSISSWTYKNDPLKRHVGPMAQDFHTAFGLNGDDDTHISEVDIAGVSLSAIQELSAQMKLKDEQITEMRVKSDAQAVQIAELTAKLTAQTQSVAEMKSQFDALSAALVGFKADRLAVNR